MNDDRHKSYPYIDYVKLISAYIIVAIHTLAFSEYSIYGRNLYEALNRYIFDFAVPFFFAVSGFFLYKKIVNTNNNSEYKTVIKKYAQRLFFPYCFWGIFYFVISFIGTYNSEKGIIHLLGEKIKGWFFSSPGGGLWYVQALLLALVMLHLLQKNTLIRYKYLIIALFWILASVCGAIYDLRLNHEWAYKIVTLYESIFVTRLNVVFYGIYFFSGFIVYELLNKFSRLKNLISLIIFYLIYCIGEFLGEGFYFVSHFIKILIPIFLLLFLCSFISNKNDTKSKKSLDKISRTMSSIIYFTHFTLVYGSIFIAKVLKIERSKYATIIWIVCCILLTIYSILLIMLDKNKKIINRFY